MILYNMGFEVLDISGDIGLRACGSSIDEAFVNAGIGMFSLITDVTKIQLTSEVFLDITGDSTESLLVNYLNELIFQFDAYGFTGGKIEILEMSDNFVKAKVVGESFDSSKHSRGLLIKAATYHNLKIEKADGIFIIDVIFDI
jgi:SHS2 domain-containing protein